MRKITTILKSILLPSLGGARGGFIPSLTGGLGWVLILILTSCSSEQETPWGGEGAEVELMPCVTTFEEPAPATRAWTIPSGYSAYNENNDPISIFFAQNGQVPEEEYFFKSNGKWRTSKTDLKAEDYYLYGYAPHLEYIETTISSDPVTSQYSEGARLTISNLHAISNTDFCVVTAAKNGKGDYRADADYSVTGLIRGDFRYAAQAAGEGGGKNYVYLLFDHLYAALNITMRVDNSAPYHYASLRKIKLRGLKLETAIGNTKTKDRTTATVTLKKTDGADPVTSVTYTPTIGATDVNAICAMVVPEEGDWLDKTTDETPVKLYGCYFMPQGINRLILTSTYDVYDTSSPTPNLIRKGCTATNTIPIEIFTGQTTALRRNRYTINLTVKPTFLYMMSDPDLDNPSVEF